MKKISVRKSSGYALLMPAFFIFLAYSCSTEANIQQILGKSAEAPVFLSLKTVSSTEILFSFSQPVRVASINFSPALEVQSVEEGSAVKVNFAQGLEEGAKITADIVVEDAEKNSLNVIVPFRARNNRMPVLAFNELRTEYSKPKTEFVEFLAQSGGNLGALRLFIAGHSLTKPVYEFIPAEVKEGEYIVLHLRTVEEICADETGADLAFSGGTEAQGDARDFWLPGNTKLLHKTDALWLMDQDDRIIDSVLLCENNSEWGKFNSKEAAEFLALKGAWLSSAVSSAGTTNTRTICRDESIPRGSIAANWYITATSSATPGKINNTKRYVP